MICKERDENFKLTITSWTYRKSVSLEQRSKCQTHNVECTTDRFGHDPTGDSIPSVPIEYSFFNSWEVEDRQPVCAPESRAACPWSRFSFFSGASSYWADAAARGRGSS